MVLKRWIDDADLTGELPGTPTNKASVAASNEPGGTHLIACHWEGIWLPRSQGSNKPDLESQCICVIRLKAQINYQILPGVDFPVK